MRSKRKDLANEVVFLTPSGQLEIRLTDRTTNAICEAATNLKARYFVAAEEYLGLGPHCWGVFDMNTADKNNPTPGQWSLRDPIKTFPWDAQDGAIMWALTIAGKS